MSPVNTAEVAFMKVFRLPNITGLASKTPASNIRVVANEKIPDHNPYRTFPDERFPATNRPRSSPTNVSQPQTLSGRSPTNVSQPQTLSGRSQRTFPNQKTYPDVPQRTFPNHKRYPALPTNATHQIRRVRQQPPPLNISNLPSKPSPSKQPPTSGYSTKEKKSRP